LFSQQNIKSESFPKLKLDLEVFLDSDPLTGYRPRITVLLSMPNCPKCHQPINAQVTTCPYCRTELKAYGHPGIPLHRATGEEFLCDTCTYHEDDTCTFSKRPYAKECTMYSDRSQESHQMTAARYSLGWRHSLQLWCQRNQPLLMLFGLIVVSLAIAFYATK
jgi:hypothetical protein